MTEMGLPSHSTYDMMTISPRDDAAVSDTVHDRRVERKEVKRL